MKGTLATAAALVALTLGGTPTVAFVLSDDTVTEATETTDASNPPAQDATVVTRPQAPQAGPPAWSNGDDPTKRRDKHADQVKGWAKNGNQGSPASNERAGQRADDKATEKRGNSGNAQNAGHAGSVHGAIVRAWAHCVADHQRTHSANADDTADVPEATGRAGGKGDAGRQAKTGGRHAAVGACGEKPAGHGQSKARSPDRRTKPKAHEKSGSVRAGRHDERR